nr:hypothetical protein [Bradyrhizobium sp. 157]
MPGALNKTAAQTKIGCGTWPLKWEIEEGVIRIYGVGEDGIQAFTDLESKPDRAYQALQRESWTAKAVTPAAYVEWIRTGIRQD